MLDMLSPATLLMMRQPLNLSNRLELQDQLVARLLVMAKAGETDRSRFAAIGQQWLDAIPDGYLQPVGATSLEATFPHLTRLLAHCKAQIGAIRAILAQAQLTTEQAGTLRESSTLISPYLLKTE